MALLTTKTPYAIAIHGGAGSIPESDLRQNKNAYEKILQSVLKTSLELLRIGRRADEVATRAVALLEDFPHFNAGKGSVLGNDGRVTMDAAIHTHLSENPSDLTSEHQTIYFGSVIGVSQVKNPVKLAKAISEHGEHNIISGHQALDFAREQLLELVPEDYFVTDYRRSQLELAKRIGAVCLDHFVEKPEKNEEKFGTVGAVVVDAHRNLCAATSTGGITNKKYGRVGDAPLPGCGTFAHQESAAMSATGRGEIFTKLTVCSEIHARMKYGGYSLDDAVKTVIHDYLPPNTGGLIAVDPHGQLSMHFNTEAMFRGAASQTGEFSIGIH